MKHAYLTRKQIDFNQLAAAAGCRILIGPGRVNRYNENGTEREPYRADFIYRDLIDADGMPAGSERILPERIARTDGDKPNDKFATAGTRTAAGFTPFGFRAEHLGNLSGRLIVCAGLADGFRIHEATGLPVAACIGEANLSQIANRLAEKNPAALVVVAADNDNAGRRAATVTNRPWLIPDTCKDWSDVYQLQGLDELRRQLANPREPLPVFKPYDLQAVELAGRESNWFNKLSKAAEPEQAAAIAWAIVKRLAIRVPVQMSLQQVADQVFSCSQLLNWSTVAECMQLIRSWTDRRKAKALTAVQVSPELLRRHNKETREEANPLTAADFKQGGVILLHWPMGAGKTQRGGAPFANWATDRGGFLAICHRVSLVTEMAKRLEVTHYQEVTRENACTVTAMATCLPSITADRLQGIVTAAEYLFIDEIAQVLRFIEARECSTGDGSNADVYEKLRHLVSNARCLVGADAGLDDRTIRFLESCRPGERFRIIEVRPKSEGLTVSYGYGNEAVAACYGEMIARAAQGERLWVSCESQKRVNEIAHILQQSTGAAILPITANNKGDALQKRFLANPEREALRYQIIIHSPVISSGISIEHRGQLPHFDHGYFIGGGHSITAPDAVQMMRRVRYLRAWTVAFVANSARGIDDDLSMLRGMEEAAKLDGQQDSFTGFDEYVAGIKASNNANRSDFAAAMVWTLEKACFDLRRMATDSDQDLQLSAIRQTLEAERRQSLIEADELTDEEAHDLRRTENRTSAQSDALLKHTIKSQLGISELTDEALDVWNDGRGIKQLDRFSAATIGTAEANDDSRNLSQRRFTKARVKAYRMLFEGLEIKPGLRITDELASELIDRVIRHRYLFAWLGMVPAKYAKWIEFGKDFPKPKTPQKDVGEIFNLMGLELRRREGTATPRSGVITLDNNTGSGGKRPRFYELTEASFAHACLWSERRNSARYGLAIVEAEQPEPANDNRPMSQAFRHWQAIRIETMKIASWEGPDAAERHLIAELQAEGPSPHTWLTAYWWKATRESYRAA